MKYLIALFCTVLLACNNDDETTITSSNKEKAGYNKAKESLADVEKRKPLQFLQMNGKSKRNKLFGTSVYKATITNTASIVSYNKVRIKLLYFNEKGELVENHEEEIDETIEPGNNIKFVARYKTPKGTDSIQASIMSAKAK
jgi:hypothetical protein